MSIYLRNLSHHVQVTSGVRWRRREPRPGLWLAFWIVALAVVALVGS